MAKRIMSLFLAVLTLVSTFTLPASAAPTLEEEWQKWMSMPATMIWNG